VVKRYGEEKKREGMTIRRVAMNTRVMVKKKRAKVEKMMSLFLDMVFSMSSQDLTKSTKIK